MNEFTHFHLIPTHRQIIFILSLFIYSISWSNPSYENLDSLLKVLDKTIENSYISEHAKKVKIERIKSKLENKQLTPEKRYKINQELYYEYEYYVCDMAWHYIDNNIKIAKALKRDDLLNESKIKKAHILATSGLFAESIDLLNTVDKSKLNETTLVDYYTNYEITYLYNSEYAQGNEYSEKYMQTSKLYRDSALIYRSNSWNNREVAEAQNLISEKKYDSAEKTLKDYIRGLDSTSRDYSVATSILGYIYELTGDTHNRKICLAQSAISDINCVIKENVALRQLAGILFKEGSVKRANLYLKKSLADAIQFNARLRGMQASLILPVVDATYQSVQEEQKNQLVFYITIIGVLLLFLIIAITFIFKQMKKLSLANKKINTANNKLQRFNGELMKVNHLQKQKNISLSEANSIKEESIGRLIAMCSTYISQLEAYRNSLNKKANLGKMDELFKTLKSKKIIEDTLEEFYKYFDVSFLGIFPDFVKSVNLLFPEEEKMIPKHVGRLNTELRIFALIRLGINDSTTIADFLRFSITTIYTYRSKMKNKSLYKDDFEQQIVKINSFKEKGQ